MLGKSRTFRKSGLEDVCLDTIRAVRQKLIPLGLILATLILFYFPLFSGQVLFFGDNYNLFAPVKSFFVSELKTGRFPLWNEYIFSGSPFLADINFGLLSPLNLPFFFFHPLRALTFSALLSLLIFSFGVYGWMRVRGYAESLALVLAIFAGCSGSVVVALNNLSILQTIAFFPLIISFLIRGIEKREKRWLVLSGLGWAASILGGHPQFLLGFLLTLPFYLLSLFPQGKFSAGTGLVLSLGLGVGLAAVQLLPFAEFSLFSSRPTGEVAYLVAGSLPKIAIIRLLLPWFFGLKNNGTSWAFLSQQNMGIASSAGFVGLLPLVLVGFQLLTSRGDFKKIFFLLPLSGLILALGPATPLFWLWTRWMPLGAVFRNPSQYLFFWFFWLIPLTAITAKSLDLKLSRYLWLLSLLLASAFLVLGLWPSALSRMINPIVSRYLLEKTPDAYLTIASLIRKNLLIEGVIFLLFAFAWRLRPALKTSFLGLLIFSELFLLGRGDLISAPLEKVAYPRLENLKIEAGVRYLSLADVQPYGDLQTYWNQYVVRPPFGASRVDLAELDSFATLQKIASTLPVDLNLFYRLPSPDGYGSLVLSHYAAWLGSPGAVNSIDSASLFGDQPEKLEQRARLNLKYLLKEGGEVEEIPLAVETPQENQPVNFVFRPFSFRLGVVISLISLVVGGWLWRLDR